MIPEEAAWIRLAASILVAVLTGAFAMFMLAIALYLKYNVL